MTLQKFTETEDNREQNFRNPDTHLEYLKKK